MTEKAVVKTQINAILAVLDSSVEKQPALERALTLARCFGCRLEAFVSIYDQYLAGTRFTDSPGLERARDALRASSEEWVRSRLKTLDIRGVELSVHAGWGPPGAEIILDRVRNGLASAETDDQRRFLTEAFTGAYEELENRIAFALREAGLLDEVTDEQRVAAGDPARNDEQLAADDPQVA